MYQKVVLVAAALFVWGCGSEGDGVGAGENQTSTLTGTGCNARGQEIRCVDAAIESCVEGEWVFADQCDAGQSCLELSTTAVVCEPE